MALTVSLDEIVTGGNALLAIKPHWKRVRLGDVGQVLNGYAFKADLFNRDSGMPLVRIRDVGSAASETFYSGDYDERYVVTAGDLLVGMDGDFNCARWRGPRSLLNQRVCKITVDETLYLPRFLDYVLPGYLKAINDATSSITVKHLSSRTIQDIPLPLPPMDEQREIVSEIEKQFSRLDEAVASLQRVKANLKRYKAAVLKAAVEGRLVVTEASLAHREGRSYETGEQLLQRILQERPKQWSARGPCAEPLSAVRNGLPSLPEGWTWASLDQLSDFITKGTTPSAQKLFDGSGEVQFLKVYNLTFDGSLNHRYKPAFVSRETHSNELARSKVRPGDVLINIVGPPLGQVSVVPEQMAEANINQAIARIRPIAPLRYQFISLALMCDDVMRWAIRRGKTTAGQANLTLELVRALPIPLPPLAEQTRVADEVDRRLSIVREVEAEVDANLQRAQALRKATLGAAFRH